MNQPTNQPTPVGDQNYIQTRATGRQIDYNYLLWDIGIKIANCRNRDLINSTEYFNIYEGLVDHLERLLNPYLDRQYYEDKKAIIEEYQSLPSNRFNKVDYISEKFSSLLRIQKRKAFLPSDDVLSNSWVIIEMVKKWILDEMDAQILIYGRRGKGKSTLAIKLAIEIATELGTKFDDRRQIFFNTTDIRRFIFEDRPPRGTVIIYDEAGASKGLGRRRAMTRESVEWNEITQTIRELGIIFLYTAPAEENIDSGTLEMFSAQIEALEILKSEKLNLVKFKYKDGKYWKFPRTPSGERITTITIEKPPSEVISRYKKRKNPFMYDKVKVKEKEVEIPFDPKKYADQILKEGIDTVKGSRGAIDLGSIMFKFREDKEHKIGRQKADQIKKALLEAENGS